MSILPFELLAQLGKAEDLNLPRVTGSAANLKTILSLTFIIVGALAVGFMVWAGFRYVISAGNPEDTKKAKDILLYAIIGLIITMMAFTIVNFVASGF